jgi:hypothetical protein
MKINKWIAGGLVVLTGFIFACSGEEADKQAKSEIPEMVVLPGEDTTVRELDQFDKRKNVLTKKHYQLYQKVSNKVKGISFFTTTKNGLLFIRTSRNLLTGDGDFDNRVRFGLVDETGKELLAMEYEHISNPGFVVKDMVEFKQGGKYGLYNYVDKFYIDAKYDVIYPSKIMEYIAIGEIGGKLFKIYKDGTQKAFTEKENAPNYFNLLKEFRFNYQSKFFAWWYDVDELEYYAEEYNSPIGMIMPASYISQLKVFPDFMYGIQQQADSLNYEPLKQVKRSNDVFAMVTNAYEMISDARGNTENKKSLVTINKANKVIGSVELYAVDDYSLQDANEYAMPSFKFVNDSLVEVKNYLYEQQDEEFNSFMPYTYRTKYEYYSIEKSGKITLVGNGNYPMISATDLSRNHFKGSFYRYLRQDEIEQMELEEPEWDPIRYRITDHMSVEDMEFMINELYASKGMKFTDPALHNYFSQFSWYKPKYKNVDSKLTDLEKRNVAMIKRYLKDIRSNPGKFIHATVDESHAAG